MGAVNTLFEVTTTSYPHIKEYKLIIVIFINCDRCELSCEVNGNSVYIFVILTNVHSGPRGPPVNVQHANIWPTG